VETYIAHQRQKPLMRYIHQYSEKKSFLSNHPKTDMV